MCNGDLTVDKALTRMFGGDSKPNAKDSVLKDGIHYLDNTDYDPEVEDGTHYGDEVY